MCSPSSPYYAPFTELCGAQHLYHLPFTFHSCSKAYSLCLILFLLFFQFQFLAALRTEIPGCNRLMKTICIIYFPLICIVILISNITFIKKENKCIKPVRCKRWLVWFRLVLGQLPDFHKRHVNVIAFTSIIHLCQQKVTYSKPINSLYPWSYAPLCDFISRGHLTVPICVSFINRG